MIMAPEVFHFEYDYNLRLTEIYFSHYYQKLIKLCFNYLIKISLPFFRVHEQPAEDADAPPEFLSPLEDLVLAENSLAHFETRLTPINDPSMKVEWFHNGKQLSAGSRIKTINDFGFVILEVANVMTRDSGNYTCKVIIVLQNLLETLNSISAYKSTI